MAEFNPVAVRSYKRSWVASRVIARIHTPKALSIAMRTLQSPIVACARHFALSPLVERVGVRGQVIVQMLQLVG
jgi:hypothetical protein